MQISEMLGQYNRNTANGTEELKSSQGVQRLVSQVRDLSAGSVFEGTVNYAKGGKVVLTLANGEQISARMDGKVDMKQGSAMFFQVRSNDGMTIAIRPYLGGGNGGNPILQNALTAAQIPVTDRSLAMVDAMMREQMPIDKQSLLNMIKIADGNPSANVQTLVQMTKLGMPVTDVLVNQFENYLTDRHALLNEMELVTAQVSELLGDESMEPQAALRLFGQIVDIFTGGQDAAWGTQAEIPAGISSGNTAGIPAGNTAGVPAGNTAGVPAGNTAGISSGNPTGISAENPAGNLPGVQPQGTDKTAAGMPVGASGAVEAFFTENEPETGQKALQADGISAENALFKNNEGNPAKAGTLPEQPQPLSNLLSEEQLARLTKSLQEIPALAGNRELFAGVEAEEEIYVDTLQEEGIPETADSAVHAAESGRAKEQALNPELTAAQLLKTLRRALTENRYQGLSGMQRLFSGKEFGHVLREAAGQQWLMKPKELTRPGSVEEVYQKIDSQMRQLEAAVRAAGAEQNPVLQSASDIRGNLEFMNQMNQIYNYVQLPLKMSGQSANGELYVYSNRKKFTDPDAELTAFLHLDMENLGSTDVSVRMQNRQVKTNFYIENDASYGLLEKHLPILEKRLKNKGYRCQIAITKEKRDSSFSENFLKKGQTQASGQTLRRYSFDVRA